MDAVWAGRVDTALSALPYQPQFSQDVAFSRPYFEAGLVLVAASGRTDLNTLDDLAGLRIAVEWGSEGDLQARRLRSDFPDVEILAQETAQQALQVVADGGADAALVDRVSALQFPAIGQLRIAAEPIVSDPYVVVMPRKAPILQAQVDEALEALEADGTLAALQARWFGKPGLVVEVAGRFWTGFTGLTRWFGARETRRGMTKRLSRRGCTPGHVMLSGSGGEVS